MFIDVEFCIPPKQRGEFGSDAVHYQSQILTCLDNPSGTGEDKGVQSNWIDSLWRSGGLVSIDPKVT